MDSTLLLTKDKKNAGENNLTGHVSGVSLE